MTMLVKPQTGTSHPDFFFFNPAYLEKIGQERAKEFSEAEPFPSIVIDNLVPEDRILDRVVDEFPQDEPFNWNKSNRSPAEQGKSTQPKEQCFGPYTRHLMNQFNSATFLRFLETLTGIKGLISDPYFLGGGLHQTEKGGFLKVHTDFSWYPELKLRRRLNVLLYLNRDWKEEYGGHVEFWDKGLKRCVKRVLPIFNRCVIFNTFRFSYHGHPDPLNCPEGMSRKSLAFYYYTAGHHEGSEKKHGTLFMERPGEKWFYLRNLVARCMPPILYDAAIKLDEKIRNIRRI